MGFIPIRKRIVAWGPGAEPMVLPHSAVVASEQTLLDRIPQLEIHEPDKNGGGPVAWTIFAARPLPQAIEEHHFGARIARVAAVKLTSKAQADACWIESLSDGWLFLLPADGSVWLLSVGSAVDSLLARSRVIADQVLEVCPQGSGFPSHPRIAQSLGAPGWLACGTAALGFDPLCGDGAGHAAREAILASAVVRAAIAGEDVSAIISHYRARLVIGFQRHLEVCEAFYRSGGQGPWWEEQLEALRRGVDWCKCERANIAPSRYRLNGFSLEALA